MMRYRSHRQQQVHSTNGGAVGAVLVHLQAAVVAVGQVRAEKQLMGAFSCGSATGMSGCT